MSKIFGETPARRALRKNYVAVTDGVQRHISVLPRYLKQDAMVTDGLYDDITTTQGEPASQKANKLMMAIEAKVNSGNDPDKGRHWLRVLMEILMQQIIGEYDVVQDMAKVYIQYADSSTTDYAFFAGIANHQDQPIAQPIAAAPAPSIPQSSTANTTPQAATNNKVEGGAMEMSAESRALRRSNAVFKKGVDPDNLVTVLYGNFLLTPEEKAKATLKTLTDDQKLEEMFTALERRVSITPTDLKTLIQALKDEPAMVAVADKIQALYDQEIASQRTSSQSTSTAATNTASATANGSSTASTATTTTSTHTGKIDINKDGCKVKKLLKKLPKDELKAVFDELGLYETTLMNKYSDSAVAYLDDLVRSWTNQRDAVLDRGGATWESLKKALLELDHNGIANDI